MRQIIKKSLLIGLAMSLSVAALLYAYLIRWESDPKTFTDIQEITGKVSYRVARSDTSSIGRKSIHCSVSPFIFPSPCYWLKSYDGVELRVRYADLDTFFRKEGLMLRAETVQGEAVEVLYGASSNDWVAAYKEEARATLLFNALTWFIAGSVLGFNIFSHRRDS